ncbi:MAG: hypothetical protein IKV94_02995 [Clostridia bacterium]|nr:hypothetical protein [Clostridia bacterium]
MLEKKKTKRKKRTREQIFKDWELWVLKNGHLPSFRSKDEEERYIAMTANVAMSKIKKEPQKYKEILNKHAIILRIFSKKRTKERAFKEWENWVLANGRLPSQRSQDYVERHLAPRINVTIREMKEEAEKYATLLKKYEELKEKYNPSKLLYIRTFEAWKAWTLEKQKTPRRHSENEQENRLSLNMSYCLSKMKKNNILQDIIVEYNELCSKYGR